MSGVSLGVRGQYPGGSGISPGVSDQSGICGQSSNWSIWDQ